MTSFLVAALVAQCFSLDAQAPSLSLTVSQTESAYSVVVENNETTFVFPEAQGHFSFFGRPNAPMASLAASSNEASVALYAPFQMWQNSVYGQFTLTTSAGTQKLNVSCFPQD